mmetsp:Transcript_41300/g.108987  ORF Transcript_41300/g.108987 Transcript_41300/m.108987 type:complete len:227 (+) Transcript_41300:709-1389(+)
MQCGNVGELSRGAIRAVRPTYWRTQQAAQDLDHHHIRNTVSPAPSSTWSCCWHSRTAGSRCLPTPPCMAPPPNQRSLSRRPYMRRGSVALRMRCGYSASSLPLEALSRAWHPKYCSWSLEWGRICTRRLSDLCSTRRGRGSLPRSTCPREAWSYDRASGRCCTYSRLSGPSDCSRSPWGTDMRQPHCRRIPPDKSHPRALESSPPRRKERTGRSCPREAMHCTSSQ